MAYRVRIAKAAERDLKSLPIAVLRSVGTAIDALAATPRPQGCEKLAGATDLYRVRVGTYRIVYRIQDRVLLVLVVVVGHRREVYEILERRIR